MPAQLTRLREQPGRNIALPGSSRLAASLLGTGVIGELRLMVNPVNFGSGHPVLAAASRCGLGPAGIRRLDSGNVLLTYRTGA